MAEKSGHDKPIDELRSEIARSRERVGRDLRGLHYELDLPAKLRRSFREQTVSWITAAAAVGALIAFAPMRKKKIYIDAKSGGKTRRRLVETGFALGAAGDCRVCQKSADWFCRAISPIKKAVSAF